jgi:hypothetical protein
VPSTLRVSHHLASKASVNMPKAVLKTLGTGFIGLKRIYNNTMNGGS